MKNLYIISIITLLFYSCGVDKTKEKQTVKDYDEIIITKEETKEIETAYPAGKKIYKATCFACHMGNGKGVPGSYPPLAGSDYFLNDKKKVIEQVLNGSEGEIVVNGVTYNGVMPPQPLTDEEVRDVVNYVLNSWGNELGEVTLEDVKNTKHPDTK